MATFVLLPGAASDSWYWHLVVPELRAAGHEVVAVDLPCDDDTADFTTYAQVARRAVGDRRDLVVVGQSMGAFTAALLCELVVVELLVLVAPMVPRPGETGGEWWVNTGQADAQRAAARRDGRDPDDGDPVMVFLHDVPDDVVAASEAHVRGQSSTPFERPYPLEQWPGVSTRVLLCRGDRLFPADFQRRLAAERLGVVADEIDGGHLPALARPGELAERLLQFSDERVRRRA